jgi:hypothetical protein
VSDILRSEAGGYHYKFKKSRKRNEEFDENLFGQSEPEPTLELGRRGAEVNNKRWV